jgi:N4-gp56 family major capsid protein
MSNEQAYGNGQDSSIGTQFNIDKWNKASLIEAKKKRFFGQMSTVENMPKHMGKAIKRYHYLPMLDDANINDQGIDAAGLTVNQKITITVQHPETTVGTQPDYSNRRNITFVGEGATAAAALVAAQTLVNSFMVRAVVSGGLGLTLTGATEALKYVDGVNSADGVAYVKGYRFTGDTVGDAVPESGNLYGSSKDIGTIAGKFPAITEFGGRVNRVGFKRVELTGSLNKFGFFSEYTQESLDFDTDDQLMSHISREMIMGAEEINEDQLQIDILNAAGVVRFGGEATATIEITGENGVTASILTYDDLMKLDIDLDNNRCPKETTIITGSRMVDTKTVGSTRYIHCGSELVPMFKRMTDHFNNQAFVPVHQYGSAGTLAEGEIGAIGSFKIIVVPEMLHWAGAGAAVGTNDGYRETGGNYDVFPAVVVGSGSFVNIGFQTDGKTVKFKITHKKPGVETADRTDPYGELGFMSIKWYYGFMVLRPERIALMKLVAEW